MDKDLVVVESTSFRMVLPFAGAGLFFIAMTVAMALDPSLPLLVKVILAPLVLVMAALCIALAYFGYGTRRVELGERAIRYYRCGKLEWEVPWSEVREVSAACVSGDMSIITVGLRTDRGCFGFLDWTDIPDVEKLRRIFIEMAKRSAGPKVALNDGIGWATGLKLTFGPPRSGGEVWIGPLEGVWHFSVDPHNRARTMMPINLFFVGLGAFFLLVGGPLDIERGTDFGAGCTVIGLLSMAFFHILDRLSIAALRFDKGGIALRFPSGKVMEVPWERVTTYGYDSDLKEATVVIDGKTAYGGFISPFVGDALRRRFSETRPVAPTVAEPGVPPGAKSSVIEEEVDARLAERRPVHPPRFD